MCTVSHKTFSLFQPFPDHVRDDGAVRCIFGVLCMANHESLAAWNHPMFNWERFSRVTMTDFSWQSRLATRALRKTGCTSCWSKPARA